MHVSFLPLHVPAAIIYNKNVNLRGDASERIFSGHYTHARLHSQDHFTEDQDSPNALQHSRLQIREVVIFVKSAFLPAEIEKEVSTIPIHLGIFH